MARNPSKTQKTYWRQVRAVQKLTGTSSAIARRVVRSLRESRGYRTAAETMRHPIVVRRSTGAVERTVSGTMEPGGGGGAGRRAGRGSEDVGEPPKVSKPYASLDDWIATWESWEGDYDYYEIESNVDY